MSEQLSAIVERSRQDDNRRHTEADTLWALERVLWARRISPKREVCRRAWHWLIALADGGGVPAHVVASYLGAGYPAIKAGVVSYWPQ